MRYVGLGRILDAFEGRLDCNILSATWSYMMRVVLFSRLTLLGMIRMKITDNFTVTFELMIFHFIQVTDDDNDDLKLCLPFARRKVKEGSTKTMSMRAESQGVQPC